MTLARVRYTFKVKGERERENGKEGRPELCSRLALSRKG
jgi:hypothetical protein